jgi:hypothetical protein
MIQYDLELPGQFLRLRRRGANIEILRGLGVITTFGGL